MFDVMERLMSGNDPECDKKDTIDIPTAKAMAACGTVIVNSMKLEVDALRAIANAQNPQLVNEYLTKTAFQSLPPCPTHQ